jgi:hypothetical protein
MELPQSTAKAGPDPPWWGVGYIGPGPCSFGEQAQPMICLRVKIEEAAEQNLDQDPASSVVLRCRLPGVV